MNFISKLTNSLNDLSTAIARSHVTHGYCKHCGRATRWIVHLGHGGYFRCADCQGHPDQGA